MQKHSFTSFFPHSSNFDFVGNGRRFLMMSTVVLVLALVGLVVQGINWGVEFVGGTEIQIAFTQKAEVEDIRTALTEGGHFENVSVQRFGAAENNEYLVRVERVSVLNQARMKAIDEAVRAAFGDQVLDVTWSEREGDRIVVYLKGTPLEGAQPDPNNPGAPLPLSDKPVEANGEKLKQIVAGVVQLRPNEPHRGFVANGREEHIIFVKGVSSRVMEALRGKFGDTVTERRTDYVDATVAGELRTDGILAMLYALGVILLYIAIRFDFYFSPGAIIALFHDVLVAVGVVSWAQLDFDLTVVAAFLTIIGYSINDTIVVYDRVREHITGKETYEQLRSLVNSSINETMSRTVLTSVVTFFVAASLLAFGGRVLHGFSLAMCVGIVTGTYSSFAIATPTYLWLKKKFPQGIMAPPKPVKA